MPNQLVILSGPPNAGKSLAAEALCQRYDRMLHIDVGVLRDFLRMGRLRPWDESPAGRRPREPLIASACDMARRFLDAGYGVVIDDVVTAGDLPAYREALAGCDLSLVSPHLFLQLRRTGEPGHFGVDPRLDPTSLQRQLLQPRLLCLDRVFQALSGLAGSGALKRRLLFEQAALVCAGALRGRGQLAGRAALQEDPAPRFVVSQRPRGVVVLLPPLAVVIGRGQSHPTGWRRGGRLEPLHLRLSQWSDVALLDPGDLAPDLVADRVMALAATGDALLSSIAFPSDTD